MPIRITGLEGVLKANGKAKQKMKKTVSETLVQCANILLRKSQKLVPVDTGALKSTGRVEVNEKAGLAAEAKVVYGGGLKVKLPGFGGGVLTPDAITKVVGYAFVVHERLEVYHAPPTQARFLADAVPAVRGTISSVAKRNVAVAVKGV